MQTLCYTSKPAQEDGAIHSTAEALVNGEVTTLLRLKTNKPKTIGLNLEEFFSCRYRGITHVHMVLGNGRYLAPIEELRQFIVDRRVKTQGQPGNQYYVLDSSVFPEWWTYETHKPEAQETEKSERTKVPFNEDRKRPAQELALALGASKDHYNPTAARLIKALRASGYKRLTIDISTDEFELE